MLASGVRLCNRCASIIPGSLSSTHWFPSAFARSNRSGAHARAFSSSSVIRRATPLSAASTAVFPSPSPPSYPPFPTDVPTHPLIIIDYERIRAGDSAEVDQLWKAATTIGFWYLKNHGTDAEVDKVFAMGDAFMRLPIEEKMKYEQGDEGNSFGYKYAGANATNAAGARDTIEFLNIAQDHVPLDITSHHTFPSTSPPFPPLSSSSSPTSLPFPSTPSPSHPTFLHTHHTTFHTHYPPPVSLPLVTSFIRRSREINLTLMRALGERLGLGAAVGVRNPADALEAGRPVGVLEAGRPAGVLKAQNAVDVLEVRSAVDAPPTLDAPSTLDTPSTLESLHAAHLPSGSELRFTKNAIPEGAGFPLPAHAVCNIGDALAILSGGILRSNLHRVPYLGTQTAGEWFARRIRGWRIRNREGPQTWIASRGTEGRSEEEISDEGRR
ncbi:hypothetical protein FB107DRAFT_219450 [Schizophyllum commune]